MKSTEKETAVPVCFWLQEESMVLFEDLRLCAVKPLENMDRRFCFELLSVQK